MFKELCCNNECVLFSDNRKKVVLTDNRNPQRFVANNPQSKMVCAVRIDGCLIKEDKSSDYILCVYYNSKSLEKIFIIELKGKDVHLALNQLKSTINYFKIKNIELQCRVILKKNRGKIPSVYDSEEKRFIKFIKKINKKSYYDRYRSESKVENL